MNKMKIAYKKFSCVYTHSTYIETISCYISIVRVTSFYRDNKSKIHKYENF